MRSNWKYFILIIFLAGCKGNTDQTKDEYRPLYPEPVTVALNTAEGYSVNQLTGDSIKPLINSLGDIVKSGIPVSLKASVADPAKIAAPEKININAPQKIFLKNNVHLMQEKPEIIPGDTMNFKSAGSGQKGQSFTYQNIIDNIATPIAVTGKTRRMHEPQPVKTSPLRFKDGATSNIQYLDIGQGLGYSFVHCILADRYGYLWFGLDNNGLCKYDGVSITNYTEKDGLPNNNVTAVAEDSAGNIWIGSDGGLCMFDGKNITQYTKKDGLPGDRINSIRIDKKGNIWFHVEEIGYIMFDARLPARAGTDGNDKVGQGKNFSEYTGKKGLPADIISFVYKDSQGAIWFTTNSGMAQFDGKRFIYFSIWKGKAYGTVKEILEDKNGNIWFGTAQGGGLLKYDGKNFTRYSEKQGLSSNGIVSMIEDKRDNFWICTRSNGVNRFDGKNFTAYGIEEGLTSNVISQVIEDKSGNIWFGTAGGGVNKLNEESFLELIKPGYLGNSRVRPIMKDTRGNLWFGTEAGGLYEYDGKSIANYSSIEPLQRNGLRSLLNDKKGNLWFGYTDDGGLYKYDHRQFLHFNMASGIRGDNIMSILEDRNGVIWLGTYGGGINRLNGNTFSYYNEKEKFPSQIVYAILEDKKGNLWFGTVGGGVVKYDGNNFITYSEQEGFYGKAVTSIVEDEEGNLWFGTLGAGLCKFDGKAFTYFTEKQGLSFNDVWSLKEDSTGQFWAGTDKGLSLLIPHKDSTTGSKKIYSIYNFGLQDGLKATDFNLHSVCIDNNNRIWWGTGKALITRDLKTSFQPSGPHSLSLQHIEINGQFCDFRNLSDSINKKISFSNTVPFFNYPEDLKLAYDQNHLTFHFSAIDWSVPDKIKYSYRLIGLETKWSNLSEEPTADYRNLSHGNYKFQVKAIGPSQVWTEPFTYSFEIRPAWWQTWWFKAFVILSAALILLYISKLIYLFRLRKQRNLLEKQLAVQYERQRISTEMHDDVGAGLSGIKLLTELAKKKITDKEAADEIEKIHDSVGNISANMKEVIWSLDSGNDTLENTVTFIQKQVRRLLENYPCKLSVDIPDKIPVVTINGNDRRNIYLIVKEAAHNIIKHSGADTVHLSITCDDKMVITLSDNGRGIVAEKDNDTGNGMKNMRRRIQQLNGKFFIKNDKGLTLTFEIPLPAMI
ncbi:MAG: two-component regulator propeller domain-containing protein [Chitinophagales bacterium]